MAAVFSAAARIASRQHGRISHAQLLAAGVGRDRIKRWRRDGLLHPVHVGVYALGNAAPSRRADLMAAVLASGRGAVISHESAAHALGLLARGPSLPHVTVVDGDGRRRRGLVVHRVRMLDRRDVVSRHGIPMTSAARVLLDLAPRRSSQELTNACHEAWVRHRTTLAQIEACIARNPTKKGAAKLRRAAAGDPTLSALETGFLALLERHGLPRPRTNIDHGGDKVDCHWEHNGLTVELLSYRFHASRRAFENDVARRRRSDHLALTWGDVFERGAKTVAELAPLLC
ncbi:MAG: hypothetical protein ACRDMZ_01265 [Solirubrobacteraceae bacterium]